jgi:hypothetical protein
LLENVTQTVDQFMNENISDKQARLVATEISDHIVVNEGAAVPADGADEKPNRPERTEHAGQRFKGGGSIEDKSWPMARRRIAESRLQMLSTMVMMG